MPGLTHQVTEASSSVIMESQGFRRGLNKLVFTEGLDIDLITTDWAPSVRKIREEYKNIHHELDPWHVSKGRTGTCRAGFARSAIIFGSLAHLAVGVQRN